jgi:CRP-like cAMP-binding protein
MLRPLLEPQTPAQRLQRLSPLFPQPSLAGHARLAAIIRAPAAWLDPWTRVCALEAVSQPADADLSGAVVAALEDPDPLVRESAVSTLARHDTSFQADCQGGKAMLTLVERVMLLRTVDFFGETSEEILAEAAATLMELEVKAGETILAKDQPTSAMYLIVEGQVGLQNADHSSASLGEKELFGELALLNPAPQPTPVIALTDARLLRLDQAPLFELLENHPPLAWGIIQRLAQRLQRASHGRAERARDDLLGGLHEKLVKRA